MSITAKVLLTAATSAATFAGWAALRSPASNPGASAAPSSVATSAAEPETKTSAAATRDRWERSRAEIRSVLPPPRSAPPTPPPTKNHPELENQAFRELLRACIDDLESETTGALTLSIREIGAPDVGTIYESVTVLYTNFDDPEILECLTQSMYGYIGPAPDEPFERAFSRTLPLGAAKDDDARIHQMIGGIVGSHIREIRYCETLGDGEAQGEIALTMAVGEDRRAKVEVVDSELPKPVVDCILTAARRWVFPELLAGKTFDHAFALPMPSEDPAP